MGAALGRGCQFFLAVYRAPPIAGRIVSQAAASPSRAPSPWRLECAATLRLAGPLALANLLQMALGTVDVIFVGRLGAMALAASALGVSVFMFVTFAFSALTGAVAPLIAAERGRRAHAVREIRRSVRMGLWLALLCAGLGMALCQGGEVFMLATGQNPALARRAQGFLSVLSLALAPLILSNVLRNFVSAMGRPIVATLITAGAIAVNVLGNWSFVFGHLGAPALGLVGSALSTVLTATVTLLAYGLAIRIDRRLRRIRVFGRWWRPEWRRLAEIVHIGLPIALTVMAEGGLFGSAAFLMGRLGADALAAHTIALQVAALFFQIPFGIGQAATIRVGHQFGAGDHAGIARAGLAAILIALAFQIASATAMLLVPRTLLSIYLDLSRPGNAELVTLAGTFLTVAAAFQLADGLQAVAAGMLRGLQDTRVPMLIALFGYWLPGFGTAVWLGFGTPLAGTGIWIGLAIGLFVVAALLVRRWSRRESLRLLPG